jgi:prophage regulatory protein
MVKLIAHDELRAKGILYSKVSLWRLEREGKFPKRVALSAAGGGRYVYVESEIDAWIAERIAARDSAAA